MIKELIKLANHLDAKGFVKKIFVNPIYNEERDCPDEPDYERD